MNDTKKCRECGERKELDDFSLNNQTGSRSSLCRLCKTQSLQRARRRRSNQRYDPNRGRK